MDTRYSGDVKRTAQRRAHFMAYLDYEPESGFFFWKRNTGTARIGQIAGSVIDNGYRQIQVCGDRALAHRLAWLFIHGSWPQNTIDHINGKTDDNRIDNLRDATVSQNCANRRPKTVGRLKGTTFCKETQKWAAQIGFQNTRYRIGFYESEQEAFEAYSKEAVRRFGEFARLK